MSHKEPGEPDRMIEAASAAIEPHGADFDGIWSASYRRLTLGLSLIITCAAMEAMAVATALPATAKELGGLSLYGWAFSAFMFADLVGIVAAGSAADRQGLVRPFVLGVLMFTAGLLIAGFAPTMLVV